MNARILLVEDDTRFSARLAKNLSLEGFEVKVAETGEEALRIFHQDSFDLILSDIKMPGMSGIELMRRLFELKQDDPFDIPIIFLTSVDSVRVAVDAMKGGAADYITKDSDRDEIVLRIEKVLNGAKVREENRLLKKHIHASAEFNQLIAESDSMKSIIQDIDEIAEACTGILIEGETGVGKEIVARYIHNKSPRAHQAFIDVNCAALPTDNMFQSEVFGHEKGAFTGASARKQGKLELANHGTLFLDEIGDMPLESQGKILRALETQEFERLGGNQKIRVDIAVIAATNKNLNREVEEGRFRQDLLYRLDIIRIKIPSLRERVEDIVPLTQHFLKEYANKYRRVVPSLAPDAVEILQSYSWPGNVRELKNLAERIIIRHKRCETIDQDLLQREGLRMEAMNGEPDNATENLLETLSLEELEKHAILEALEKTGWVQTEAAKLLKISSDRMHSRIKKYKIQHPSWRSHRP